MIEFLITMLIKENKYHHLITEGTTRDIDITFGLIL
jgi:hypothetical protein